MKLQLSKAKQPKKLDFILTIILILMFISSIIAIYTTFPLVPAYLNPLGQLLKQVQFYIIGFIVIGIVIYFGNDKLYDWSVLGYKIILVMLIYLAVDRLLQNYVFGRSVLPFAWPVNGATRWFNFPFFGTLQPSDFMKVIILIISAYVIVDHNATKREDSFESDFELFRKILKWLLPPLILIFLQPDTGIPVVIVVSLGLMLICSGIRKEWIYIFLIVVVVGIIIFFYLYYFNQKIFESIFGSGYKVRRIYGWLEPETYARTDGLQLWSSLLSIGSGGVLGHGVQANLITIPEAHTDFIFAVISSDFGFLGAMVIIVLCLSLDLRLLSIALRADDEVEKLMIIGFMGMLFVQQIQNIGMILGILPISGMSLPLISCGGSSILSYMIAFGIVMNASAKAPSFRRN